MYVATICNLTKLIKHFSFFLLNLCFHLSYFEKCLLVLILNVGRYLPDKNLQGNLMFELVISFVYRLSKILVINLVQSLLPT